MSWKEHHTRSEKFASQAELLLRSGDNAKAEELYRLAAEEELKALEMLDKSKKRTLGITAVSAASLSFKAQEYRQVEKVVCQLLATDFLPDFAVTELQNILQVSWNENAFKSSGIEFIKGEVLVSVSGGEVVSGGAPLELIHRKVDEVRNLFYRTIEMLLNRPFRKRGSPSADIQEQFRPWLLQAPVGSYQFAVRVQKPTQMSLFQDATPEVEEVTRKFLEIIDATSQDSLENLKQVVPDSEYRRGFLKLTRNLAPTGKSYTRLRIKSAVETDAHPIVLSPTSRKEINSTLKEEKKTIDSEPEHLVQDQLVGTLRALHLDRDWIELNADGHKDLVRIYQTGDVIDDIVGPLVNQRVVVDVFVRSDNSFIFRDIQSED